ncbi:Elongation factor Ts, mitochondrial [Trichinella pseudospiralis]|uniref:Elongation factor Ts, mitochondrial n=1 Tax=Trichinella pseudospiralis TaxID=6337 RepID=A0A0V1JB74_TRIPS|nr:Elongation factor Ts, mitochondrial [Trichinella pseudospiralis]KRZ32125.1 Elongation factor Ts, mitochondrial [Trichinella pseudospiralis]
MILRNIFRKFSTATGAAVSKDMLMKLRKKTSFSFVNCRKALEKFHYDFELAEKWLYETAQKEGWQKAAKLASRKACQGLVATFCEKNLGILVEVNCETDFVAKNEQFQNLVRAVTVSCYEQFQHQSLFPKNEALFNKCKMPSDYLESIEVNFENHRKPVKELMATSMVYFGEKINLRRSTVLTVTDEIFLINYAHPRRSTDDEKILLGQYGAIVAFQTANTVLDEEEKKLIGKQLCQHIVGMNPTSIGDCNAVSNEKSENTGNNKMQSKSNENDIEEEDDDDAESFQRTELNNETELMHQSFLLAPNMTVADYAKCKQIDVLDFERFQVGETLNVEKKQRIVLFRIQIRIFQSPHFVNSCNFKMLFFIIFTCLHYTTAHNITDDMITQWLDSMAKLDKFTSRQFELVLDFQIAADKANGPLDKLVKYVSPEALQLPSVRALFDLAKYYTPQLGIKEDETAEKMQKIEAFLDEVMKSNVIKLLVNHFKLAGFQEADTIDEFRKWIKKKWFTTYARRNEEGINDSSLFEHFFFGETVEDEEKVLGLHYWLRYVLLESEGQITYLGYKMKEAESYATVAYKWNGYRKDSGTMLLRTTPEFEIALFSIGYLLKPKRIHFGRCTFAVASHEAEENGIKYYTSTFVKSPKCKKLKA